MDNNHANSNSEEQLDWASRLERIRYTRKINQPNTYAPLIRQSEEPIEREKEREKKSVNQVKQLDAQSRDKILHEHMLQWQKEHNAAVEKNREEVETDDLVLLQDNWLSAQHALQMKATDKQIESTHTVWFNPKTQTVEMPIEPEAKEMLSENDEANTSDEPIESKQVEAEVPTEPRIIVNMNVLNPQAVQRKEVFCLSEAELTERLIKRMRPHITDAVNGMIRVALQKQMALLSHNLQQILSEQAPDLVEEVLEYNVKRVMEEIKYELKYKR